ncbi:MAG TPA: hypothetical protein VJ698_13115 [Noviherbaspirillum sp.]|uniref:hypothetical protein n=1 Tax=Noviherbaspirillum sp. TaxID=1926288 RepID=UPI002B48389E|nr:hypothetical protein [Noviherbaspirillum sp.]HJV86408.1 hypothetical protein [Noviherbaspirillum sp.]
MKTTCKNPTAADAFIPRLPSMLRRAGMAVLATAALASASASANANNGPATFEMVRSPGIVNAGCLPNATATVSILPQGPVEVMSVSARGLPPRTDFDFFVLQVPNAPFGLSWYQGDIETDAQGNGHGIFIGRFNEETFIVAPGSAAAPSVHNDAFPDATTNPPTGPVHTFHLGLWFNSPQDATAAGCPGATTPFNGEHNAGVQVLNTSQFPNDAGPLRNVKP